MFINSAKVITKSPPAKKLVSPTYYSSNVVEMSKEWNNIDKLQPTAFADPMSPIFAAEQTKKAIPEIVIEMKDIMEEHSQ